MLRCQIDLLTPVPSAMPDMWPLTYALEVRLCARQHWLNYPPSILFRYLKRLVRSLVYLPK